MKILRLALTFALAAMMISAATANGPPPTPLWSDGVVTNGIAVSKDGQYVAVASLSAQGGEIRFYSRGSGTPLWKWGSGEDLSSVAISANGDYLAAGSTVRIYYWANARTRTEPDIAPTWVSDDLGGPITGRCLDMSDDGDFMVACGAGANVFYWGGMAGRSDSQKSTTWSWLCPSCALGFVYPVDISSDGDYVAAGTHGQPKSVAYWKNARSLSGINVDPNWESTSSGSYTVIDVAVSDDGNFVAAATGGGVSVHYWAGARSLTGDPDHTWWSGEEISFTSVDMSCDGDAVIAGAEEPAGVYFWGEARGLTGKPQAPSWTYGTTNSVWDVAINDAGTYMAAVDAGLPGTVYFFDEQGNLKWEDETISGDKLSMSCDGGTLAAGTPSVLTAYLLDTGYSGPCCGAVVGGVVTTADKPTVLAPYLALLVLIGGAGIAFVSFSAKKKHSD